MPKQKLQCPNCGSNEYAIEDAGGSTTTFVICKKCGNKAAPKAWEKAKARGDDFETVAFNYSKIKKTAEAGIGGTDNWPSSKPLLENDPEHAFKRKKSEERRRDNEKRLQPEDKEDVSPQSKSVIKETGANKMPFNLKKLSNKKQKAFNLKVAREFRWTEEQIHRKNEIGKNMVFPEGKQTDKENSKEKGHGDEARRFDTVDRKDMHRSPDPKDIIPGYEEWYNREVDSYYDGWLEDHIKNSGGEIVGSNTEYTMNLDDGERYKVPRYPEEAVYEKQLETRHHFDDDYQKVVADNKGNLYTQGAIELIKKAKKELGECPECKKFGEGITCAVCANDKIKDSKELPIAKAKKEECPDCYQFGAMCPTCANKATEEEREKKNLKKQKKASLQLKLPTVRMAKKMIREKKMMEKKDMAEPIKR